MAPHCQRASTKLSSLGTGALETLRGLQADVALRALSLLGCVVDDWTRLAHFSFLWRLWRDRKGNGRWFLRQPDWHAQTVRRKVQSSDLKGCRT